VRSRRGGARDRKRARIKALKDAADSAGRNPHQADDMRVRALLLEAKAELERFEALRVSRF
jgi:hypothetical protein